jgi:splicing factor U2AF subunit
MFSYYLPGLNKLEIAEFRLAVQRIPAESAAILLRPTTSIDPLSSLPATCVLRLSNMTMPSELDDDEAYHELKEDVEEECSKHGTILSLEIPRSVDHGGLASNAAALGNIFIKFSTPDAAERARKATAGRNFNGNTVQAVFFPEELYNQKVMT